MTTTLDMTQGKPFTLLFRFAIPLMLGNIFQQFYTVVDTVIVGRGVGLDALAALGSVDWLNWLMITLSQGFTQGFGVRIAQKFGEGDHQGLQHFLGQSAVLSAIIALSCLVLGQLLMPLFLFFLQVPTELSSMAETYIRILFAGFPVVILFNYCAAILRAVGDSKTPLLSMSVASVCNIVLDLIAVFLLDWGIAGAAIATVVSQGISCFICIHQIWKTAVFQFRREYMQPDPAIQKNLLQIGLPASTKNILVAVGGIAVQRLINDLGLAYIAGFTATAKFGGVLEIAAISYNYAVTTYIGQNYGAGRIDRVKKGVRDASLLAIATSILLALVIFLFGRPIIMLFISSEDPVLAAQAGNIAYTHLCVMAAGLWVLYMLYVVLAILQGMGNTVYAMLSGILETVVRVTAASTIVFTGFQSGIFFIEPLAWLSSLLFLGYHYFRLIRRASH